MKYIGIDYGSKRLGVAVSDADGRIAFPRGSIPAEGALAALELLIQKEGALAVVVGDTRAISGGANVVTPEAQSFCDALAARVSVPVERVFEAWSSAEAARFAPKGHAHDDAAAAAIILQRYLAMRAVQ